MGKTLANIALIILKFVLEKNNEATESKKSFLAFVAAMEGDALASVNLNDMDRLQVDELNRRRSELDQAQAGEN